MNTDSPALPMTCQELVELVTEYFDDTLPTDERARFESHLTTCRRCTAYLEQMRKTIQLTGTLSEANLTTDARDHLLEVFRSWKAGE